MAKKKVIRIPVSERALVARINRKFRSEGGHYPSELRKTRGARAKVEFGDFYVFGTHYGSIDDHHVDPEELARELGVLADWEYFDEEGGN